MSRWNAKGDTATTVIMWMGSLLAALIAVIWIGKNLYPTHIEADLLNEDLERLQFDMSDACNSYEMDRMFNPRTEEGTMTFNRSKVCISTKYNSLCKDLICDPGVERVFDLHNLTYIIITRLPGGAIAVTSS